MNKYCLLLCVLLAGTAPSPSFAQEAKPIIKEKKISKHYTADKPELSITNFYGDVQVNTWDKNEVTIEIKVTGISKNSKTAQDIVNSVNIADDARKSRISFVTKIAAPYNDTSGKYREEIKVEYIVNAPVNTRLTIDNTYGDVRIGKLNGKLDLKILSGSYQLQDLNADDNEIYVKESSKHKINSVTYINKGKVTATRGGRISVGKANVLTVWGYDSVAIDTVSELGILNHAGKLEIGSVADLDGTIEHTQAVIHSLTSKADVEFKDCGNITFMSIGPKPDQVDIHAVNSGLIFHFPDDAVFDYDITLKKTTFYNTSLPEFLKENTRTDDKKEQTTINGGKGTGGGFVKIDIEGGNTTFF